MDAMVTNAVAGEAEQTEEALFRSLSGDYSCIFRVNLQKNLVEPFRLNDRAAQALGSFGKSTGSYRQWMAAYVREHVDPAEQGRLLHLLSPEYLMQYLAENRAMVCECHETRNGHRVCHRVKAARMGQSKTEVVIGIVYAQNIDEEDAELPEYSRRLLVVGEPELAEILRQEYDVELSDSVDGALHLLKNSRPFAAVIARYSSRLLHHLRSDALYRRVPVLVTAEPGTEALCLEQGASELLTRPFQPEVVKNRVRSLIALLDSTALLHLLERDAQTGLYTKELFFRHAEQLRSAGAGEPYVLVCINIENYRMIEEKYGSSACSCVADFCAQRIKKEIPGLALAGRLSEDNYIVMCREFPAEQCKAVLRRVRHEAPVPNLVVKVGVARVDEETPVRVLCDHAQCALEKIRQIYGVYYEEYSEALRNEKQREQRILDSMEKALEQHQFQVYYQPKHLTSDGRPVGAEALVRWIHPEYGFMSPGEFIPLFERVGFIRTLDRYVWTQVGRDINRWKAQGLPLVPVSINLSRRDFESPELADDILSLMQELKLEPEMIHIELTESAFTEDPARISDCLARLHQANFVIELDDFGAGYSSLTTLNSLDLDVLKIDMSIIRQDVPGTQRNALEFCMELAKMMNLETVAEGIETESQLSRVRSLGCDYIQGYYYSKPIPVDEFERYMERYAAP